MYFCINNIFFKFSKNLELNSSQIIPLYIFPGNIKCSKTQFKYYKNKDPLFRKGNCAACRVVPRGQGSIINVQVHLKIKNVVCSDLARKIFILTLWFPSLLETLQWPGIRLLGRHSYSLLRTPEKRRADLKGGMTQDFSGAEYWWTQLAPCMTIFGYNSAFCSWATDSLRVYGAMCPQTPHWGVDFV